VGHQLFLIRHGETAWSATGKHTGHTDVPLTDSGVDQARRAGRTLPLLRGTEAPARVLTSPRQRALDTARLAGLEPDEVSDELAEWDYGEYEGITTDEIRETVPGWTVWSHPILGGESAEQVGARADKVIEHLRALLEDTDVILVGHGHFSRVLVARWLGLRVCDGIHFALEPAAISVLGEERGRAQLKHLNVPPIQGAP
jgi:broad specificity phosphatase PhoE